MKNVPVWFIATFFLVLSCLVSGKSIYNQRNEISISQEIIQGDISVMEGVELELSISDYSELWWGIDLKFNHDLQADVEFKPLYNTYRKNHIKPQILAEDNINDMLEKIIKNIENGKSVIKIADYMEFMNVKLELVYGDQRSFKFEGDNNLYKIKVPESALADIHKEFNSTSIGISGLPHVRKELPSIVIEDRMYFTIPNFEMAHWDLYNYYSGQDEDIEYLLNSGILSIPFKEDNKSKPSYSDIVVEYPMKLDHITDQYIIGMEAIEVEEDDNLLLITMEKNKLYLYLYDPGQKALVLKKEIGTIPENKNLIDMNVSVQDKYLILHYELDEEISENGSYKRYCVAAVYELEDEDFNCLIENEYLNKLDNNIVDYWYIGQSDIFYANDKLYILAMNNGYKGEYNTSILVMAIDNSDVLYFSNITSSMEEDYTIALSPSYVEGENKRVFSNDRSIETYTFAP